MTDQAKLLGALIVTRRPLGAHYIDLFGEDGIVNLAPEVRELFINAVEAENELCDLLRSVLSEHTDVRTTS